MDGEKLESPDFVKTMLHAPTCRRKDTTVLLGNAPSALDLDLRWIRTQAFMFGCNRGLDLFKTHAMLFCDRQPYWQYFGRLYTYPGTLILSRTIFDPTVQCREEPVAPKYDGPYIDIGVTTDGVLREPSFDWKKPFVSGPSIALVMLQIAVASGYKRIGLVGIDYDYKNENETHFWGKGIDRGAFEPGTAPRRRIFQILRVIGDTAAKRGIEIRNLSPVRGPIDDLFPPVPYEEWLR